MKNSNKKRLNSHLLEKIFKSRKHWIGRCSPFRGNNKNIHNYYHYNHPYKRIPQIIIKKYPSKIITPTNLWYWTSAILIVIVTLIYLTTLIWINHHHWSKINILGEGFWDRVKRKRMGLMMAWMKEGWRWIYPSYSWESIRI